MKHKTCFISLSCDKQLWKDYACPSKCVSHCSLAIVEESEMQFRTGLFYSIKNQIQQDGVIKWVHCPFWRKVTCGLMCWIPATYSQNSGNHVSKPIAQFFKRTVSLEFGRRLFFLLLLVCSTVTRRFHFSARRLSWIWSFYCKISEAYTCEVISLPCAKNLERPESVLTYYTKANLQVKFLPLLCGQT